MIGIRHPAGDSLLRTPTRTLPRLSRNSGFWAVAFAFLAVSAFSTAPSSLYGLYEHLGRLELSLLN